MSLHMYSQNKESSRNSIWIQKTSIDSTNVSVAIIQGRMDAAQNETEASYWAQQMLQLQQVVDYTFPMLLFVLCLPFLWA